MPKIAKTEVKQETTPEYKIMVDMLTGFQREWNAQFNAKKDIDAVKFSKLSVVALTQLSAIIGVDVGMMEEQYTNVCRAQFIEAHKRAPKFS